MQKLILLVPFAMMALLFTACEEIGPDINLGGNNRAAGLIDTSYVLPTVEAPQDKKVLIMDFTGVRCKNCPLGAEQVSDLLGLYPDNLVAMGVYSEFLCDPYPGDPDLRTEDAENLQGLLEPFLGKPSGAVDMFEFAGSQGVLEAQVNKWANYVQQRVSLTPPVNVTVENDYNATSRELVITVTLHYTTDITTDNRLAVAILESNIIAAQLLPDNSIDSNFVHKHVIRNILTPTNGEALTIEKVPGRVVVKQFSYTIPAEWDAEHLDVVAYVHRFGGTYEVLQAGEAAVIE